MFAALRRLRPPNGPLIRFNTTAAAAQQPAPPPAAPTSAPAPADANAAADADATASAKKRRRPRKNYARQRPSITLERPRDWCRPVAPGVLPAYDEALRYIAVDSRSIKHEAQALAATLGGGNVPDGEAQDARARLETLEIMSEVNLPWVRWKAANGMADLKKPVYRHLVEKRWREDGALDLLMERIHQMNVVPDLIPDLRPGFDLRITFPEPPPESVYLRTRVKRRYVAIEPGIFLHNEQTKKAPRLYTTVFHTDERLYTMMLVDPDVPDEETRSFTTYLHWLHPNISLSSGAPTPLPLTATHTPYVPPHPAQGTPYHRYVLLFLPQASATERIRVPPLERRAFSVREFAQTHGLRLDGGAAHMWRAVWDAEAARVWDQVLKVPQPRFGHLPRPDPYAEVKSKGKYLA